VDVLDQRVGLAVEHLAAAVDGERGEWAASGVWVIGLLVAIELIMHGWSYVVIALAARRAA
jgi:hypothetical protein